MMKTVSTHLLNENFNNINSSSLKTQRIKDIQDVIDEKFSNANGEGDAVYQETYDNPETPVETGKKPEETTAEQAKDVSAKEHAKKEPMMIFGIRASYIGGTILVLAASYGIYRYVRMTKQS